MYVSTGWLGSCGDVGPVRPLRLGGDGLGHRDGGVVDVTGRDFLRGEEGGRVGETPGICADASQC